jgi:hypothetical protein
MSASSAIVTNALLATAGETTARPRSQKANFSEPPKRPFAETLPLVKAQREIGTDKVSGEAGSKGSIGMTGASGPLPGTKSGASQGNAPPESLSLRPCNLAGNAGHGKGGIALPLSAQGSERPREAAPANRRVPADPARGLKTPASGGALPKGPVSTAQVPSPHVKGQDGVPSGGRGAPTATTHYARTEAQGDTVPKRDIAASPVPASRASRGGVPILKENASAVQTSRSTGKLEGDGTPNKKTVGSAVLSQTTPDRPAQTGDLKSRREKQSAPVELAPNVWSFGAPAQVTSSGATARPNSASVGKTQSQTPCGPAAAPDKAPVPQQAIRTPRQIGMQNSAAALDAASSERSMQGLTRRIITPGAMTAEWTREPARKMAAFTPKIATAREHVGAVASREAPQAIADGVVPKTQPIAPASSVRHDTLTNLPTAEESTKSRQVILDVRQGSKLENMPVLDKPVAPPRAVEPSLVNGHADNRRMSTFSREAAAGRVVNAGASHPAGKAPDCSAAQDGIHEVQQFSALEGAESATVQRVTSHITEPVGGESASVKTPVQSISEQILDSVRGSISRGEQELSIRLRPPELGSVCVRFTERNDQIHAVLEVDRSETRREIERALPDVLQSLHDAGVPIRKLEVTTGETREQERGKEQLPQDSWQHGSDQSHEEPQYAGSPGRSAYYDGPSRPVTDPPETIAVTTGPADRIDTLM